MSESAMTKTLLPRLIADIGGTNARFALSSRQHPCRTGAGLRPLPDTYRCRSHYLASADAATLGARARAACAACPVVAITLR